MPGMWRARTVAGAGDDDGGGDGLSAAQEAGYRLSRRKATARRLSVDLVTCNAGLRREAAACAVDGPAPF